MNIRRKTVQRLLILFSGLALLVGAFGALVVYSVHKRNAQLAGMRQDAFAAYQQRDYFRAVGLFGNYFARRQGLDADPEAMLAYAKARTNAPTENGRNLFDAINSTEQYLQLRTDDGDAQHLLLRLYTQVFYNKEARALAARMLARDPDDVDALRSEVDAMAADGSLDDALKACDRLNQIAPLDLTYQRRELELMNKLKRDPRTIVARADGLLRQHPNDGRFVALMAAAYGYAGDAGNAKKSIEAAARLEPADADSVLQIVSSLNREGRFDLSEDLLRRALARDHDDPRLLRQYVQRLWEQHQFAQVIELTRLVPLDSPGTDPATLGYRALALDDAQRRDDARKAAAALAARRDDVSQAWAIALQARFAPQPLSPAALIQKDTEALVHDSRNPVLHALLAEALGAVGQTDKARQEWLAAAQFSPTWAAPLARVSEVLRESGQCEQALRLADIARRRSPGDGPAEIAYTLAWYDIDGRSIADPRSPDVQNLLKKLEAIQSLQPNEPATLPAYVSMLAQLGQKDKAIAVVKSAIAAEPPPSGETFARLTDVSRERGLGLEDLLLDRAQKTLGLTPAVAFARAMSLYQSGRQKQALELLESQRQSHPTEPRWMLTDARFRDQVDDPGALKCWTELADSNPNDLVIQYAALNSPSRVRDRGFWRRTIDRVKGLTGDSGRVWKLEDARWRLSDPAERDFASIVKSLQQVVHDSPELPDGHLLLAEALLRTDRPDNLAAAAAELTAANELRPGDFQTVAQLVHVLALQGKRDPAVRMVDALTRQPNLPASQRLWAAETYSDLGFTDAGIKLLNESGGAAQTGASADAVLATLYRRAGRLDDAAQAYLRLLDRPDPDAGALGNAAEFFASRHDPRVEARFLDRLQKLSLRPGAMEVLKAHLEELFGSPDAAVRMLQDASKAHPQAEQVWQELAGFYLRHNQLNRADDATAEGLRAIPASPLLQATREQIGRVRVLAGEAIAPLVEVISHDPTNAAATDALKLMADAHARGDAPAQTVAALRQLCDRNPRFLPLQEVVVQRYVALGRYQEAADVASRAAGASPNNPEPLRLLCAVQSSRGDWEAARQAALRWKQKSIGNPIEPDLTIATMYLRQHAPEPDAAIKLLAPYVADSQPPQTRDAALPVYCRALIVAGREDDAAQLLEPLLSKSPRWQTVWLELGSSGLKDEQSASQWLQKISPLLAGGAVAQRLALAAAWQQVGTRYDSPKAFEQARDVIEPILARPPVPAAAWELAAIVRQSMDDLPRAEEAWRQALRLKPADADAQNNLAYVLLREGGAARLAEAERLSNAALATAPGVSTFYDTQARIQVREGNSDAAVKNFRTALEKDPDNVEAMIGLADLLQSRSTDRPEARALLVRITTALHSGNPVPAAVRKQFERVKIALTASE